MIAVPAGVRIVVASRPVDFRNGLDGLAAAVQQALRENPFAGDLFVFRAKRADRIKIRDLSRADVVANLTSGLATEWHPDTTDPKKWIFKLRQGVRFHDGSAFDADAVI